MLVFKRALSRPSLALVLPKKRTLNRLLFDHDARLPFRKVMPILTSIYDKLDDPSLIALPKYTKHTDLMTLRAVLRGLRTATSSMNKNLVELENELVEQAAEMGNPDAIAMLAFEAISQKETLKEDYEYAQKLIAQLTEVKHPLVYKLAGDLAFSKNLKEQAVQYWSEFLKLESDTILASHVYASLGTHLFNAANPNLAKAKEMLDLSLKYGELDSHTIKLHFYLAQLYSITDPERARHHMEISASRGLKESFPALGFLELNTFDNPGKAIEWFRLGVEGNNDVVCLVGQFDANVRLSNWPKAAKLAQNLKDLKQKLERSLAQAPVQFKELLKSDLKVVSTFFDTRRRDILRATSVVV